MKKQTESFDFRAFSVLVYEAVKALATVVVAVALLPVWMLWGGIIALRKGGKKDE